MEDNKAKLNEELLEKVSGGWEENLSDSESPYCGCEIPEPSPLDPSVCKNCIKTILRE